MALALLGVGVEFVGDLLLGGGLGSLALEETATTLGITAADMVKAGATVKAIHGASNAIRDIRSNRGRRHFRRFTDQVREQMDRHIPHPFDEHNYPSDYSIRSLMPERTYRLPEQLAYEGIERVRDTLTRAPEHYIMSSAKNVHPLLGRAIHSVGEQLRVSDPPSSTPSRESDVPAQTSSSRGHIGVPHSNGQPQSRVPHSMGHTMRGQDTHPHPHTDRPSGLGLLSGGPIGNAISHIGHFLKI